MSLVYICSQGFFSSVYFRVIFVLVFYIIRENLTFSYVLSLTISNKLSKLKERIPRLDEFLPFVKLTYQFEKIDPQSKDKWKLLLPFLNS